MAVILSYGPGFILVMLAVFLLLVAITGGPFDYKDIKIPKLDKIARFFITLLGIVLLMGGTLVGLLEYAGSMQQPMDKAADPTGETSSYVAKSADPTMDMSGYVAKSPDPTMDMSNYVTKSADPTMDMSGYVTVGAAIPAVSIPSTPAPDTCLLWDRVTLELVGQTICVRGIIRRIDYADAESHWDFTTNRTGFFAISLYLGWHPVTGRDMSVGDCVAVTGVIQALSSGRPYIYWGANSRFKAAVKGTLGYYEHPDLQVIEGSPSFCQ